MRYMIIADYCMLLHILVTILLLAMLVNGLQYEVIEQIGEGISGLVFKGRNPETQQMVALKTIYFHDHQGVPSSVIREIAILKVMDHPNIVK